MNMISDTSVCKVYVVKFIVSLISLKKKSLKYHIRDYLSFI